MPKIKYRLYPPGPTIPSDSRPMHGDYLMSRKGRGGYLILGVDDRGLRGGLGEPLYRLLVLDVERVSRAECERKVGHLWLIRWDRRKRRVAA